MKHRLERGQEIHLVKKRCLSNHGLVGRAFLLWILSWTSPVSGDPLSALLNWLICVYTKDWCMFQYHHKTLYLLSNQVLKGSCSNLWAKQLLKVWVFSCSMQVCILMLCKLNLRKEVSCFSCCFRVFSNYIQSQELYQNILPGVTATASIYLFIDFWCVQLSMFSLS